MKLAALGLIAFTIPLIEAGSIDKETLLSQYRDKFVVVTSEGIATGLCAGSLGSLATENLAVTIKSLDDVKIKDPLGCGVEPVHKGEVLKISHVAFHFGYLLLCMENVSPHAVTRGIGGFAHQTLEQGRACIQIRAGSGGKELDEAEALAAHWFKPYATAADAAKLGNTASGVFVNQVKAGMSLAEVESVLGVPQTRADLGEKILYKYKDMTVEFHDGRVADVR